METTTKTQLGIEQDMIYSAFPKTISQFIIEDANSKGKSPTMYIGPVISALAGAIGNAVRLQIKSNWHEYPSIYSVLIAKPGSGKTPVLSACLQPLDKIQDIMNDEYLNQSELAEAKKESGKKKTDLLSSISPHQHIIATDFTIEAINAKLDINGGSIVLHVDELASLLNMDKYSGSRTDSLKSFLSIWSSQRILSIRKTGDTVLDIPNPVMGVIGSIQPAILTDFFGTRQDGLQDRFLPSFHKEPYKFSTEETDQATIDEYCDLVISTWKRLRKRKQSSVVTKPWTLNFSEKAAKKWIQWNEAWEVVINTESDSSPIKNALCKFPSHLARLCLIQEIFTNDDNTMLPKTIGAQAMDRALVLINFYEEQLRKVSQLINSLERSDRCAKVNEWMMSQDTHMFPIKKIISHGVAGIESENEAAKVFHAMEDLGYGRYLTGKDAANHGFDEIFWHLENFKNTQNH